jgi:hypothetical protein
MCDFSCEGQRGFWVPHRYRHDDRGDVGRGTEWRFMTVDGIFLRVSNFAMQFLLMPEHP